MKSSVLRGAGIAILIVAGCSHGGSKSGDARDGGLGGMTGDTATEPSTVDGVVDGSDVPRVIPQTDAATAPLDSGESGDAANAELPPPTVDATRIDLPTAAPETAKSDLPTTTPDTAKTDVAVGDAAVETVDAAVDRAPDSRVADSGTGRFEGFRFVAPGGSFTCALGTDDSLWCWGSRSANTPTPMGSPGSWGSLDLGMDSACAIKNDGTLWCWGSNSSKQLGLGDSISGVSSPTQVGTQADWTQVSAGTYLTCGLRGEGALWCWGGGSGAVVGDGSTTGRSSTPRAIGTATDWTRVSVGEAHACGVRAPGSLWCWGQAIGGQLGLGIAPPPGAALPVTSTIPARVGAEEDWSAVSAGGTHTCGIRRNGTLWCWGRNSAGQLGASVETIPSVAVPRQVGVLDGWVSVSVGDEHTCAMRANKTVWCWGAGEFGQLGLGGQSNTIEPTQVGDGADWREVQAGWMHSCGIKTDGRAWCWGRNHSGQLGISVMPIHANLTQVGQDSDWQRVTMYRSNTCGLRAGTLWCWGESFYGNVGDGTTEHRQVPTRVGTAADWTAVAIGPYHTCGLRAGGSLWCWGDNSAGELGVGKAQTGPEEMATPQRVGADKSWLAVDTSLHTCAVASDGSLWCWGQYAPGLEDPTGKALDVPTRLGTDTDWTAISVDTLRTCGLRADRSLWCWGDIFGTVPVQIGEARDWRTASARSGYFCGIKTDGSLWCGDLRSPLVQKGTFVDWLEATPFCGVRASGVLTCALLAGTGAPFDSTTDWMSTTAGASDLFSCGVKKNGTLWCAGTGQLGEMGHGDAWRTSPVPVLMTP